jgi:hypothetical protein
LERGGEQAVAAIKAAGTRIQRTAQRILSALDLPSGGVAEPPGEDGA